MLFDCPEIKPQQSRNIQRIPYELVKIYSNLSTITHELTTGRGEMNVTCEDSSTFKEESVENKEECLVNLQ